MHQLEQLARVSRILERLQSLRETNRVAVLIVIGYADAAFILPNIEEELGQLSGHLPFGSKITLVDLFFVDSRHKVIK